MFLGDIKAYVVLFALTLIGTITLLPGGSSNAVGPVEVGPPQSKSPLPQDEIAIYSSEDTSSGATVEYRVSRKRLLSTSGWSPEREQPPLSIPTAVAIAKKWSKPANAGQMRIIGIELAPVEVNAGWRWYYLIRLYDTTTANQNVPPTPKEVIVLMDGSVVRPSGERK